MRGREQDRRETEDNKPIASITGPDARYLMGLKVVWVKFPTRSGVKNKKRKQKQKTSANRQKS